MFYLLVVGECMERLKNMYIVIYMYLVNEIKKKMEENEIVFGSVNVVWKEWSIIWFKKIKVNCL